MEIKECIHRLKSDYPEDDKMYLTIQQFVFESHLKEVEELRKQLTWIPVSERKEIKGGKYLIVNPNNSVDSDKRETAFYRIDTGMWISDSGDVVHPSHYLPIPQINNK